MTIKEFAAKYAIPYHLAYKASFRVHPVASMARDRDFDEKDLHAEAVAFIKRRLRDTRNQYRMYADAFENLKGKS